MYRTAATASLYARPVNRPRTAVHRLLVPARATHCSTTSRRIRRSTTANALAEVIRDPRPDPSCHVPCSYDLLTVFLANLWQTAVRSPSDIQQAGCWTRPGLLVCGGAPRRNRTGDPILTIDGRPVRGTTRHFAPLFRTTSGWPYRRQRNGVLRGGMRRGCWQITGTQPVGAGGQRITRQQRIVHGVLARAVLAAHVRWVVQRVPSCRLAWCVVDDIGNDNARHPLAMKRIT